MRIAIGQLWQETNTLNPLPTRREDFQDFGVLRCDRLVAEMADTNELGGFIQSLRRWPESPEIIGLVRLPAWPSGAVTEETFHWLAEELEQALRRALPVDGLLLALHGSMVAEGQPDVEGEILHRVRRLVGGDTPVVASLDLHANLTAAMVGAADVLVPYHSAPHIDVFETGVRAAGVLRRILVEGAQPEASLVKLPMVLPPELVNTEAVVGPSAELKRRVQSLEKRPDILSAGILSVQPWLDIPDLGCAVIVTSDGDRESAAGEAEDIAREWWSHRCAYLPQLVPAADAVRTAWENGAGLTVISEGFDATTSGAPGDSTHLLAELLCYSWSRPALATMVAPDAVAQAQAAGIGAELSIEVGGRRDHRFCSSLPLTATVSHLFDARFTVSGHLGRNLPIDMGPSAVLASRGVHLVTTSRSGPHYAPELFCAAGLDPFAAQVLVAKSPCGFRAAYQDQAREILLAAAPGCAPSDFWNYPYQRIPRPLWPWDADCAFTASPLAT